MKKKKKQIDYIVSSLDEIVTLLVRDINKESDRYVKNGSGVFFHVVTLYNIRKQ